MVTILEFVTDLILGTFELVGMFVFDVLLSGSDVLATVFRAVSILTGSALIVLSVIVVGYLAVGALIREFGVNVSSPGRTRVRRD
ncbi:hypothetical protein [Haloprofundus halobius]|uniref:hypothetical protein n=1 Tax=Haloprofundus halobius TaxID=2876194 RepID=UPI001CCC0C55|nr:hypothetical protein [Haloprofundus halobius]